MICSIINNGSYYFQCWKQFLLLNIFVETMIFLMKCSNEQHLFEIRIFCNILNVFTIILFVLTKVLHFFYFLFFFK